MTAAKALLLPTSPVAAQRHCHRARCFHSMATQTLIRALRFPRYRPFPPSFLRCLSHALPNAAISERFVLDELADLLPTDPKPPIPRPFPRKPAEELLVTSVRDRLLSPDDRLRGVFLQKPRGRHALESALSSSGVDLTPEIFADVMNKGNLGGAAMVSFFAWAVVQPKLPVRVETYNVILRALGRRKFFSFFDEILQRMKKDGVKPNVRTLEILLDSLVAARQVSKAVCLFRSLEDIGGNCNSESFNILLRSLCCRLHVGAATSLFNLMSGKFEFDNMTFNEIMGGWAKLGRVDKVEAFWTMMQGYGLMPDDVAFSHLIEALGRAGQADDAVRVFQNMEENGYSPSILTYNALISNFISVGNLDKCIEYYKDMFANSSPPDINTYHKLISALLKFRRVADALEMFDEMLGQGILPSTGMVTSFIEPLCSFGPPHAAMLVYKKSRRVGCTISLKAYKLLLMRLSRFGKSGMVLKIWEEMQESGYASDKDVYEFIVNGLCNIGKVDNAVFVAEESLRKGICLGKIIYSKLNSKLLEMNKVETAYKFFLKIKEARTTANSQSFCRANGWHF